MKETSSPATVHDVVLDLLRGRDDAVLFGAHVVNAYADEPRMSQDVDIMSARVPELAEELASTSISDSTSPCESELSAKGWGIVCIRFAKPVTAILSTRDLLKRCHHIAGSKTSKQLIRSD